jgi:hypothetical protein
MFVLVCIGEPPMTDHFRIIIQSLFQTENLFLSDEDLQIKKRMKVSLVLCVIRISEEDAILLSEGEQVLLT